MLITYSSILGGSGNRIKESSYSAILGGRDNHRTGSYDDIFSKKLGYSILVCTGPFSVASDLFVHWLKRVLVDLRY